MWRPSVCGVLVAAVLGCFEGSAPTAPADPEGPLRQLVLITVDTLRADHVGAYGTLADTPHMDRLAARSVVVETAFTPVPTTGPAHASLLTGLHPWRHGVVDNAVPLAPDPPTVAAIVQEAGVATAAFVSSYILHSRFGLDRGFEHYHFDPSESYRWRGRHRSAFWTRGGQTTDAALAWLADHRAGSFFVWVHYFDPHSPYDPPKAYRVSPTVPISIAGKQVPKRLSSFAAFQDVLRAYRGEVHYVDAEIGRLVAGLAALGLGNSAAVVLTADHGEGLGDHGILEHGKHVFDELVRVPLFVRAEGLPEGVRRSGLAQLEDLAPTLLGLLGAEVPRGLDGRDLLPWLRGDVSDSPRDAILGRRKQYRERPDLYFQRGAATKWVGEPGRGGRRYELDRDPQERDGIEDPQTPDALAEALSAGSEDPATQLLDETAREALEALGYLEE